MKSITFILPSFGNTPIGGFKIVYEYANRLLLHNYAVNIVHTHRKIKSDNPIKNIYRKINFGLNNSENNYSPNSWFKLNKKIQSIAVPYIENKYIPDADFIFATEYTTAKPVNDLPASKGRKFYFIQSLETWLGPEKDVIDTWKLPLEKIVISKWLSDYGSSLGLKTHYIPNGLDYTKFFVENDITAKNPFSIAMLYHANKVKGSKFGLEAISKLKNKYPALDVTFFSVYPKPDFIPYWINYIENPTQIELRKIYNNSAIFISPSLFEGFPLPPAEAMMCGCAVVATNIGGHSEYITNGQTGILVESSSGDKLYDGVSQLLDNNTLRMSIAKSGNIDIMKFHWDSAVNKLIAVLGDE